ncbi:hypothetical protein GCM10010431_56920 [Streptomyces kunmingensis]
MPLVGDGGERTDLREIEIDIETEGRIEAGTGGGSGNGFHAHTLGNGPAGTTGGCHTRCPVVGPPGPAPGALRA